VGAQLKSAIVIFHRGREKGYRGSPDQPYPSHRRTTQCRERIQGLPHAATTTAQVVSKAKTSELLEDLYNVANWS